MVDTVATIPEQTTPTPVVAEVVTPVVTETPVETVAPVETPVAPVTPAPVETPVQTVLGEALTEAKPTEITQQAPKEGEVVETKNEGGQSEETAPPPKYDPFTFPENTTLDEKKVSEFTGMLSELELLGKADHAVTQEIGQKLVDFHVNEVKNAIEYATKALKDSREQEQASWKELFLKDPEIGGNRFQTTVDSALTFIRTHGGTPEQQAEFKTLMDTSGLGNHPAMIRMLASAGKAMSEGKPLAAPKPVLQTKSKVSTMYGQKS